MERKNIIILTGLVAMVGLVGLFFLVDRRQSAEDFNNKIMVLWAYGKYDEILSMLNATGHPESYPEMQKLCRDKIFEREYRPVLFPSNITK